jgi:hypothetical protein
LSRGKLEDGARWNALEGRVQEKKPLEDREPERLVGLVENRLALVDQVPGHVAVGDRRDYRDRHQRAANEEQQQPTTEPALERLEIDRHVVPERE